MFVLYICTRVNFRILIAKTIVSFRHFYTTKIHILFKTTILFLKKNLISISFLINQIAI